MAVFVLAYAVSPILAARSLVQAAKTGDEQALERQVDFPAFRASLKDELSARMFAEMRKDDRLGGLSGLGMMLAPTLVSGAVDAFVTPQAISAMVQEGQRPSPIWPRWNRTSERSRRASPTVKRCVSPGATATSTPSPSP